MNEISELKETMRNSMETVEVDIERQKVRDEQGNTLDFIDVGLSPNGEPLTDRDEIEEHLKESRNANEVRFLVNESQTTEG